MDDMSSTSDHKVRKSEIVSALAQFHVSDLKQFPITRPMIAQLLSEWEYDLVWNVLNLTHTINTDFEETFVVGEKTNDETIHYDLTRLDGVECGSLFHLLVLHGNTRLLDLYFRNAIWTKEYTSLETMFDSLNYRGETCFEALQKNKQYWLVMDYFHRNPDTRDIVNARSPHNKTRKCICSYVSDKCMQTLKRRLVKFFYMFCRYDCESCKEMSSIVVSEPVYDENYAEFHDILMERANSFDFFDPSIKEDGRYTNDDLSTESIQFLETIFTFYMEKLDCNMLLSIMEYNHVFVDTKLVLDNVLNLYYRVFIMSEFFEDLMGKKECRAEIDSLYEKTIYNIHFTIQRMLNCVKKSHEFVQQVLVFTIYIMNTILTAPQPLVLTSTLENIYEEQLQKITYPIIQHFIDGKYISFKCRTNFISYFMDAIDEALPRVKYSCDEQTYFYKIDMNELCQIPHYLVNFVQFCVYMSKRLGFNNSIKDTYEGIKYPYCGFRKIDDDVWESIRSMGNVRFVSVFKRKLPYVMCWGGKDIYIQ